MVNQITGPPNTYDFGLDFNYAVWTPNTVASLVNVPWNNDYRDIVRFSSRVNLNAYINSLEPDGIRIEKMSYVKPNTPVRLNLPINRVLGYNYLRATNQAQPIPGEDTSKSFYYFITDVRYLSPNATEVILQLDVWQTFGYDVKFGTAYVERGHIGIANENQFDAFGRDYLTVPEGFDVGSDYRVIAKRSDDIMGMRQNGNAFSIEMDVIAVSTVDLASDPGTASNPVLVTAAGTFMEFGVSGAAIYVWDSIEGFLAFMDAMKETPWVTQGIISVTMMPKVSRYQSNFPYLPDAPTSMAAYVVKPKLNDMFPNWRNSNEILDKIGARYKHLKKFLTYPYMGIEMTCYTGNTVLLKPESWLHDNAQIMERITYTPPNRRVEFMPRAYNSDGRTPENFAGLPDSIVAQVPEWQRTGDDFGDYLDVSVGITNFPTIPIVNNGQLGYLAANSSVLSQQRMSATWAENRAQRSAQNSYDQASKGLETAQALNQIGVNADVAQTGNVNRTTVAQSIVSGAQSVVGGTVGGALGGGGKGAAAGATMGVISAGAGLIGAGIQTAANDEALAIRNAAAAQNLSATQSQGGYVRDTNRALADFAARGDYANEINAINARVQDAAMIQPSTSGQYGGESINLANATVEIALRWKFIDKAAIRRIGEFWLRYGYAINTVIYDLPEDMMVMTKFTYWKLTETYLIAGPMPETYKQAIRGMFEKGVTVYRNPADIGTVDFADNQPIGGISY